MTVRRIQLRRDTTLNWESINPSLRQGEVGVELGTSENRLKVGDGFTNWNDLGYVEESGLDELRTEYGDEISFTTQLEINK
tara:strand:+ start:2945 stop:3187 length:243 start_codon:yes stop_codon:yes gene_type:complete